MQIFDCAGVCIHVQKSTILYFYYKDYVLKKQVLWDPLSVTGLSCRELSPFFSPPKTILFDQRLLCLCFYCTRKRLRVCICIIFDILTNVCFPFRYFIGLFYYPSPIQADSLKSASIASEFGHHTMTDGRKKRVSVLFFKAHIDTNQIPIIVSLDE